MSEPGVYVEFRYQAVQDEEASRVQGRWVGKDVEYAYVTLPGGRTVIPLRVTDEVRARYKPQYDAWKRGEEAPLDGMSLKDWPAITRAQAEEFWRHGVRTLEDLIGVPDTVLTQLGSGARTLQNRARAWLEQARSTGVAAEELARLRAENGDLRRRLDALAAQVQALGAAPLAEAALLVAKRRPRKQRDPQEGAGA